MSKRTDDYLQRLASRPPRPASADTEDGVAAFHRAQVRYVRASLMRGISYSHERGSPPQNRTALRSGD